MTLDEALEWADKFNQSLTPTTSTVTAVTLAAEVRRLQAEVTGLRIYAPARRAQASVKAAPIAPTQWSKWGITGMIDETDEQFAARAGRKVTEATA